MDRDRVGRIRVIVISAGADMFDVPGIEVGSVIEHDCRGWWFRIENNAVLSLENASVTLHVFAHADKAGRLFEVNAFVRLRPQASASN